MTRRHAVLKVESTVRVGGRRPLAMRGRIALVAFDVASAQRLERLPTVASAFHRSTMRSLEWEALATATGPVPASRGG